MNNSNSQLFLKLQRIINNSSSNNTYKIISKNLVKNLQNLNHITIEELA